MNPKHVKVRIEQCRLLASASNCDRLKVGALLVDPVRNVVLMDGYNGGPRGGGRLCGGERCLRDGLGEGDVRVTSDPDYSWCSNVTVQGKHVLGPVSHTDAHLMSYEILHANPPIPSGTRYEIGCHHAEANVIANAAARGVSTDGAWLFVTHGPCVPCAKLIHHAGIKRVMITNSGARGPEGEQYLLANGVEVEVIEEPEES